MLFELPPPLRVLVNMRGAGGECTKVQVQSRGGKSIPCTEFLHTENGFPSPGTLSMQDLSALSLELVHGGEQRVLWLRFYKSSITIPSRDLGVCRVSSELYGKGLR